MLPIINNKFKKTFTQKNKIVFVHWWSQFKYLKAHVAFSLFCRATLHSIEISCTTTLHKNFAFYWILNAIIIKFYLTYTHMYILIYHIIYFTLSKFLILYLPQRIKFLGPPPINQFNASVAIFTNIKMPKLNTRVSVIKWTNFI